MDWAPVAEEKIWDMIDTAAASLNAVEQRLWKCASIIPEKWKQEPYGTQGGGFWVVGLLGRHVVWYNDIEDGFNISKYVAYGEIGEYWCNQDTLATVVKGLTLSITGGS